MNTQTIRNRVTSRIYGNKRGWVFTSSDFCDMGSMPAVRRTLERLTQKEVIRRLARGVYDYPQRGTVVPFLPPDYYEGVGKAIARQTKSRILPSGGYAANVLGLNLDVPAKIIFLTDGSARKVDVDGMPVVFKRTTHKNVAVSAEISGLVIQGLKYMKKRHVDSQVIDQLKRVLDKNQLLRDISCAPAWIANIIREVVK
jgi:hypothetical protein